MAAGDEKRDMNEPPPPKIDGQKSDADGSTPTVSDGWYYASEGEKHGPTRPNAIIWFERLMFSSLVLVVVNIPERWEQVEGHFGFILTILLVTLGTMIYLILMISRKRSNVAKWIFVILYALGFFFGPPMELNFIPMVQFVIQAVAIGLLFTPTARVWLNAKRIEQVSSAPIQPHLTANRSVDIRSGIKSDADEPTPKAEDGWYYASEGEKHGPVEPEKLTSLLASGVIGRDALVWRHGMSDWMPLNQTEIWVSVPEAYSPPPLPKRPAKRSSEDLVEKKRIEQNLDIGFWWLVRTAFKVILYIGIGYIVLSAIAVFAYVALMMMYPPGGHR